MHSEQILPTVPIFYHPYHLQALLPLPSTFPQHQTVKQRLSNMETRTSYIHTAYLEIQGVSGDLYHVFIGNDIDTVNVDKFYSFLNFCQRGWNILSDKQM